MIKKSDLKENEFLQFFTDEMLEKLIPITEVLKVKSQEIIFKEGDPAEKFYLVKSGHVLLEKEISKGVFVNVCAVDSGEAFELSALLSNGVRSMTAICDEHATLLAISRNSLLKLMDEDKSVGYMLMKHAAEVLYQRWVKRTEQFLNTLKSHPDYKCS